MTDLAAKLRAGVEAAGASGASLAVLDAGAINVATAGSGVTPDSVFHIGSITKSFTATLAMQLVDEGRLRLADTLAQHLPELALRAPEQSARITMRQLLNHTSGIDGDRMDDTGSGDDCLERFVGACSGIDLLHAPGTMFSYCNVGYILLGRIIEKLTATTFDHALAARVLTPLGIPDRPDRFDGRDLPSFWPRSNMPSGSRLALSATELVSFAGMHLDAGLGANKRRVLSAGSVEQMQAATTKVFPNPRYEAWGLGWMLFRTGANPVFGHDGGIADFTAYLRIIPRRKAAVALLTKGAGARRLFEEVVEPLLREFIGADLRTPEPVATSIDVDPGPYCGTYERHGLNAVVRRNARGLELRLGGDYGDDNSPWLELAPVSRELFVGRLAESAAPIFVSFIDAERPQGPAYLHVQERAYRRAAS